MKLAKGKKPAKLTGTILWVLLAVAVFTTSLVFALRSPSEPAAAPEPEPAQPEPVVEDVPESLFASPELEEAYNKNNDVVGWLTVDGCEIDDPVVQGADNDVYLRRGVFSDEYDVWGCYFLDWINVADETSLYDRVSIIYGHALDDLPNDERFSKLKRFLRSA